MYTDLAALAINQFCGTARRSGFTGDIVISVYQGTANTHKDLLQKTQTVVYDVSNVAKSRIVSVTGVLISFIRYIFDRSKQSARDRTTIFTARYTEELLRIQLICSDTIFISGGRGFIVISRL
jgi:hypothetical protein